MWKKVIVMELQLKKIKLKSIYGLSLNKLADNYALNTIRIKERCQRRDIVIYLSNIDGKKKE
jgi:hypothetical protein